MRIAIGIEYDGTQYCGWQSQQNHISIQSTLESALSKVANEPITIMGAGRTDRGVHALGQVAHFDTNSIRNSRSWILGSNTHLPADISILWAQEIADDFHARYSALSRRYQYFIYNHWVRPAVWRQQATWFYHALDENKMQQAANYFLGEHDFASLRSSECQAKTTSRCVNNFIIKRNNYWIMFDVTANAFLHHMVRNMVGVLLKIGTGEQKPEWVQTVLEARDRRAAGITAPAQGLYLVEVKYPEQYQIPGFIGNRWF